MSNVYPSPLSDTGRKSMRAFWEANAALMKGREQSVHTALAQIPDVIRLYSLEFSDEQKEHDRRTRESLSDAMRTGDFGTFLEHLRQQGAFYARAGISFDGWVRMFAVFRDLFTEQALASYRDRDDLQEIFFGMGCYFDLIITTIGASYLAVKERTIRDHEAAIRELSTPILQLHGGLILPLVGIMDAQRAQQLTANLLESIRLHRAQVVILDITGVPFVDTSVAAHFSQLVKTTRLMGAETILTGISAEVSQTLVMLGADLDGIRTFGDLEQAMEEARRLLRRPSPNR